VLRTSREEHCISLVACCELATHNALNELRIHKVYNMY